MAVSGTSKHEHRHDSTYYGLLVPTDENGVVILNPQGGDLWIVTPVLTVVAGKPGAFSPLSEAPVDLAELNALGTLGQRTPWNEDEYV